MTVEFLIYSLWSVSFPLRSFVLLSVYISLLIDASLYQDHILKRLVDVKRQYPVSYFVEFIFFLFAK